MKKSSPPRAKSLKESLVMKGFVTRTCGILIISGIIILTLATLWFLLLNPHTTRDSGLLSLLITPNKETVKNLSAGSPPTSPKPTTNASKGFESPNTPAVPRHLIDHIPDNLHLIKGIPTRKKTFIKLMLPLALVANSKVQEQRQLLLNIRDLLLANQKPTESQISWISDLAKQYRVSWNAPLQHAHQLDELMLRVDQIPVSLILAQAAIESAWGTSRFAQKGNALFGEWTMGKGIVPLQREAGKNHKIRIFSTPLKAVESFIHNLNTHRAYAQIRTIRHRQRMAGTPLDGYTMAMGLDKYSQLGQKYITIVQQVIKDNTLSQYDTAHLQ